MRRLAWIAYVIAAGGTRTVSGATGGGLPRPTHQQAEHGHEVVVDGDQLGLHRDGDVFEEIEIQLADICEEPERVFRFHDLLGFQMCPGDRQSDTYKERIGKGI